MGSNGFVSLIAVTLASFLILLLVLGMAWLMVGELRQAEDNENQTRAYYTSESQAELAVLYIKNLLATSPSTLKTLNGACPGAVGTPPGLGAVTDCTLVTNGQPYDGPLPTAQGSDTIQFGLSTTTDPSTGASVPADHFTLEMDGVTGNAYFETELIAYQRIGGSVAAASNSQQYVCPNSDNAACTFSSSTADFYPGGVVNPNGTVSLSGNTVTLQNLYPGGTPMPAVLRIKIIGGTAQNIKLIPYSGATALNIQFPQAIIDVTARAGQSFARVEEVVPILSGTTRNTEVLGGDAGLCKTFTVFSDTSGPISTDGGSDTCP